MGGGMSLGDNQTASYESGASRLCKSVVGAVCVAPLLIIGMCVMLGWNERHAVCNQKAIDAGEKKVHIIGCTNPLEAHGALVMLSCDIQKNGLPHISPGGDFAHFSTQGTGLLVDSEMLQCVETKHEKTRKNQGGGGGTTTITTYTYSQDWKNSYVNSHDFDPKGLSSQNWRQNCGCHNPSWPAGLPPNNVTYAPTMKVGAFTTDMTSSVPLNTPIFTTNTPLNGWQFFSSNNTYMSNKSAVNNNTGIGRVRVRFFSNDWSNPMTTLLGENNEGVIIPWIAPPSWLCSGFTLLKLKMGLQFKNDFFDDLRSENMALTWVLRVVGLLVLWFAFCLCFGPLEIAGDCIPCIGPMLGDSIGAIACCISCLPATACCLGIAGVVWVAMRPVVGIPLMLIWLLVMVALGCFIAKRKKSQARQAGGINSAPMTAPLTMSRVSTQPQPRQMPVQVPPGSGPGGLLQVQTPAGLMQVQVPAGCGSGSTFMISY